MDLSPAVVHGCRRDFIEAWTSLDTALSGGLHITRTVPDDEEGAMIAVGVDTHKERHHAVALDPLGQLLGERSFTATAAGYAELQRWAKRLGGAQRLVFGVEGAGSWGAALCEHLQRAGHSVVEVERPRRWERRAGKSDRIDALAAAKSVLSGEHVSTPRGRGILSALWMLLVARHSVVAERTRVLNQLQALNATAPVGLRERVGEGTGKQLERRVMSIRARATTDIEERVAFGVMRDLAARSRALAADARRYERELAELVRSLDRTLLDEPGIGPISAAKLLASDPTRSSTKRPSPAATERRPCQRPRARPSGTASAAAATARPTTRSTQSHSSAPSINPRPAPTSTAASARERPSAKQCARTPPLPRPLQTTRRGPLDFIEASLIRTRTRLRARPSRAGLAARPPGRLPGRLGQR
jgi:transposase